MRAVAVLAASLPALSPAGGSLIKYTMAVTDPHAALRFAQTYFPIESCDATPVQQPQMCNGTMTCGPVGRTNLKARFPHFPFSFPHMVNATARPIGDMSVADVEAHFDAKMGGMREYDQFMDFAFVAYSPDLGTWLRLWQGDGVDFLPITWRDDAAVQYWGAVVRIPHTQVTAEVFTAEQPADADLLSPVQWRHDDLIRLPHALIEDCKVSRAAPGLWIPVAVSKFASSLDSVAAFYTGVMGGEATFNTTAAGGVRMGMFAWPGGVPVMNHMQVRVIERAGNTTGSLTAAALERAKFRAHNMTRGRTPAEGGLCGVSKWYDNHWGLHAGTDFGAVLRAMDARGWPYFQLWATAGIAVPNMYVVDPTGDSVQLQGTWRAGAPEWTAYAADDALCGGGVSSDHCVGGLCTQGNCTTATPPRCSAAVAERCPGLQSGPRSAALSRCTDCVYAAGNFAALTSAECGCYNADLWQYCVSGATDTSCTCNASAPLPHAA